MDEKSCVTIQDSMQVRAKKYENPAGVFSKFLTLLESTQSIQILNINTIIRYSSLKHMTSPLKSTVSCFSCCFSITSDINENSATVNSSLASNQYSFLSSVFT